MKINPYSLDKLIDQSPEKKMECWVCCYEQRSAHEKVLRNLPPTFVEITSTKTKYGYVLEIISKPIKGKSKKIPRTSTTGSEMIYYTTYEESKAAFNKLIFQNLEQTKLEEERILQGIENRKKKLESMFIDTDYLIEKMSNKE